MKTVKVSQETIDELSIAMGEKTDSTGSLYVQGVCLEPRSFVSLTPEKKAAALDLLARFLGFDASVYGRSDHVARDFLALKRETRALIDGRS